MDTHGGGWTVLTLADAYNAGNRALHALTSAGESMSLRVVLSNTTQDSATVDYASVRVESEDQQFKIHIGKFLGPKGWDSLSYCNGMMFSTFDKDNDWDSEIECAVKFRGGWWYRSCYEANLNGLNLNGHYEDSISGIEWGTRGGWMQLFNYSYPGVLMAVRPSDIVNEY
ncbi:hypothetical protein V5799_026264 [Amblyomma americanum]|uniref:Fibrinogen C-terminal domain-containing protein n=1 Tax=Amblyomma americanum TaxID=6943 RepID=A0AAQ4DJ30_AMBAM